MKLHLKDRVLLFLSGLLLLSGAAALTMQLFFEKNVLGFAAGILDKANADWRWMAAVIAFGLIVLILALYCVSMIFRHQRKNKGFVRQRTEDGDLNISIKTLDSLTQNCINTQQDIKVTDTKIEDGRDGVTINLRCSMPSGINIPLVVNNLQRQIKQYVTACSGVDVKEIQVQVDSAEGSAESSDYQVPVPLTAPMAEPLPDGHKSKRMLHQRMFGHQEEQTVILPPPPEEATKHTQPAEKPAEAVQPEADKPVETEEKPAETATEEPAAEAAQAADTVTEASPVEAQSESIVREAAEADEAAARDADIDAIFDEVDHIPLIELVRDEIEADQRQAET